MRIRAMFLPLSLLALASCAGGRATSPEQRAAAGDDLNPSGRPYVGPAVRSSFPPADNSFQPLYCHSEGPGTVCARNPD